MPLPQAAKQGLVAGLCFAAGIAVTMAFAKTTYPPLEVLLTSSQSSLGQDLAYPVGPLRPDAGHFAQALWGFPDDVEGRLAEGADNPRE